MPRLNRQTVLITAGGVGLLLAARALVRWWREYDLRDKVVLVTGGSRGLGLVLSRQLLHQGARVAICARDEPELGRARSDLGRNDARVLTVPCDITDWGQVHEMVRLVQQHFGRIDVLINNAGTIQVGPVELMTLDDFEEAMKVHFWGPLYTVLAVLPAMRQRREGRIVNISSIGGKVSVPHLVPYNASKFALVGLSEGLRAELAKDGIVVTTVCPGLMRTGSPRQAFFKGQHRAEYAWFSISDALPLVSQSAERSAAQIIAACKRGDAEVVLSLPAKLATTVHSLFPGWTADVLGLANTLLLPAPGGIGTARLPGKHSSSALSPSWLTTLSDRAAQRNNENI
ncbi:MAG TPA: SDR family oxidoreductase [Candidatus Tectomicrobia bacterium]|nr:SDR family oxidoreductase [Candidatus Tectomicrobia bacterium]